MPLQDDVGAIFWDPIVKRIDFHLGGLHISPERLGDVGRAIAKGRIALVVRSTGSQLSAGYSPHHNRLTISSAAMTTSTIGRAGILHEGVHVLVDLFRCVQTTELTDEAAAYLAEVIYLHHNRTWVQGGAPEMAIYKTADQIASQRGLYASTGVHLAWNDYAPLRTAVNNHPAYSGIGWMQRTSGHGVP